ncbi:dna large subunit, partial [Cystoisospora suis]
MPRYSFSPSTASSSSPPPSSSSSSLSSLYTMRTSQHASPHTMNDVGDHPLLSFSSSSSSAYGYYDLIGSKFAHPLSLYQHLPDTSSVPLSTFEEITVNRLRVLNFLHEKFGTETSLSPSFLRGDHTLSSRGRPSLSSSSASSSSTVKNASAASSPGSIGMGSSLSSGGHQQRTTGEGELKELLIETGLMLDISAGVGRGTGAVGGSLVGSVYTPEQRRKLAMRDAISHFALRL